MPKATEAQVHNIMVLKLYMGDLDPLSIAVQTLASFLPVMGHVCHPPTPTSLVMMVYMGLPWHT